MGNIEEDERSRLPAYVFDCLICYMQLSNPVGCVMCGKMLCNEHVAGLLMCPFCKDKPFRTEEQRSVRFLMEEMLYACGHCKGKFSKSNLNVHEGHCSPSEPIPRYCGVEGCEFQSADRTAALIHLTEAHGDLIWANYTAATEAGMHHTNLYHYTLILLGCT